MSEAWTPVTLTRGTHTLTVFKTRRYRIPKAVAKAMGLPEKMRFVENNGRLGMQIVSDTDQNENTVSLWREQAGSGLQGRVPSAIDLPAGRYRMVNVGDSIWEITPES